MMDHDLLMMIYGALIGVGSSIVTSLFQSWLNRREYNRKQKEEQTKKTSQIYLPTIEEVRMINSNKFDSSDSLALLGVIVFLVLIYQLHIPVLALILTAIIMFFAYYIITKLLGI